MLRNRNSDSLLPAVCKNPVLNDLLKTFFSEPVIIVAEYFSILLLMMLNNAEDVDERALIMAGTSSLEMCTKDNSTLSEIDSKGDDNVIENFELCLQQIQ